MELDRLNYRTVQDAYPDRWQRGDPAAASIINGDDTAEWLVQHPDSDDRHCCYLARDEGGHAGGCSCKGYQHHDGPCSHLIALRRAADTNLITLPRIEVHRVIGDVRAPDEERAEAVA
jgi:hypothetical protein